MTGKSHLFKAGWLLTMLTVMITVSLVLCRAPIRGAPDEALVGKAVSAIQISADWSQEWRTDDETAALFRGQCRIAQGAAVYTSESMVIWARDSVETAGRVDRLVIYMEEEVHIDDASGSRTEQAHWMELDANKGITLSVRGRATDKNGEDDPLYKRATERRFSPARSHLKQTQLTVPTNVDPGPVWRNVQLQGPTGAREVRITNRSLGTPFNIVSRLSNDTDPPEQETYITGGVNVVIRGFSTANGIDLGVIDLSADQVVIFSDVIGSDDIGYQQQSSEQKFQIYLEGHIVIRQRDNVHQIENKILASRAFYDARDQRALVLDAEFETYIPKLDATIRMRADRIRQNSQKNYHAQNAWITSSTYGQPGFRFQASDIFYENHPGPLFPPTSTPEIDPATGTPVPEDNTWVTALNTRLLIDEFPIFYAPKLSGPVDYFTSFPLQSASMGVDRIFGTQFRTTWDAFALFGLNRPENPKTNLSLTADYYSFRGPSLGYKGNYVGTDSNGNSYIGSGFGQFVYDNGTDNLGFDRRALIPPSDYRGTLQWEHRHNFDQYNAKLYGEIGYESDRNFYEQYQEWRFDTQKDRETKLQWNQNLGDNEAYTVIGRTQINPFENNTQWLPRGDIYFLGEPFLNNIVNYSGHSSVGYAIMNPANPPSDPTEVYTPLPYMTDAYGIVAQTRHEVEAPFNLGPIKFAPFVLGEAAYWGADFSGDPIGRLYGKGGVRASITFERIFPTVQSEIFNLNGLAHKSVVEAEYGISGVTQKLSDIPQWNEIDDNAQERFRMRLVQDTFNGVLPPQFDPRFYAVRTGAGSTVTAPYGEMVADQQVVRLNWNQRLQTKVGPPEMPRIKDWMTLDLGVSIFPDANRDNFGQTFGLATSRFTWNVGDRTTVIASSNYDFFTDGQQLWSVGLLSQRSLRGSLYLGIMQVKGGTLDSQIATATYSYVMSPKWISSATTAYDFHQNRSAGQSFMLTRVGEWLLFHFGANIDVSKNNVGVQIAVEPRLGKSPYSTTKLGGLLSTMQTR